jgi:hypothetical protein
VAQGYKDFTAGAILTAADLEDYCENQSVLRFASAAARDAALTTVKVEGMMAYLVDLNVMTVYSGAAWSTIGPVHGALTNYTPVLTQSGAVTKTVNNASYIRIGRMIIGNVWLNVTGPGTAANAVTISTPVTASTPSAVVGAGYLYDASATSTFAGTCALLTTTTFAIYATNVTSFSALGVVQFSAALASGDIVNINFMYEAAADA